MIIGEVIIDEGSFHIAVDEGTEMASFESTAVVLDGAPAGGSVLCASTRAVVELYRAVGGLPQRALLGGTLTPAPGRMTTVEVGTSGEMPDVAKASHAGALGHPLAPGLPDEFGPAVVRGLLREPGPTGTLTVNQAAYDPVESSSMAFETAAALLAFVLMHGAAEDPEAVRHKLREMLRPT